jgi:ABC-type multidrug transport system fused ATPase/permease subunit
MKGRIFLFAGIFILINLIIGGVIFFNQSSYLSKDESLATMHPSDYQEQGQQNLEHSNEEYDEETRQMLAEREAEIQRLKENGEWEEPNQSANSDKIFGIVFLSFVGVFLLVAGLLFKNRKNDTAFSQAKKSSFTQGLSHMASEIKGNLEKIPMDQIKNDPNISDEDRKSFQQGEEFIMGLIGQKTPGQADTLVNASPEESPLEDANPIMSHENLKQLYETELKTSIEGIEGKRKAVVRSFATMFALIILMFASFVLIPPTFYLNVIVGFILIIAAIVFFVKGIYRFLKFRSEYKSSVVKKVVQFINPKFMYDANKHISLNDFMMSKLGSEQVNKAIGDDYVCGKIDKTVFEFSELVAQYEYETTDDDGKKVKQVNTHFNGLFFLADFNKHIQGETFVMPDKAERLLGKFGQSLQKSAKGDLVKLENPEFEKLFAVFSTNQTEARYILTPAIMEGMVNIRKKVGANCYFSFIGERVYCGIEFNKALFEASMLKPVSFADVEFMHSLFTLIETIITEMNLNTRIWTKE